MVIVKLISGLGNQLFQYALARQLSINNSTPLKLDTAFFESQQLRSYKLNHYRINAGIATPADIDKVLGAYHKILPAKLYRKAELFFTGYNRHYKESGWWQYDPALLNIKGDVYLDGYWQCCKYFENLDRTIIEELTLKDKAERDRYEIFATVEQQHSSVAIHIRRGDYVTDTDANNLMGVLPLCYYEQAIKYISDKVTAPVFYIFSDDLDWAADHLKIDAPVTLVDIAGGNNDYLELDLMSTCRHNIIANSSFSWWGAFLNQNPGKIVIAPQNWVKPAVINAGINLQFPQWIKM